MTTLAKTFAALSDETRLSIVERLMERGETPAGDLVRDSGMTAPAISRHLKVLRNAGLVAQRAEGTRRLYSARADALRAISDWTISHRAFWGAGLDRLERALMLDEEDDRHG